MPGRNHSRYGRNASWAKLVMGETRGYHLSSQCSYKDLHATMKSEKQVKSRIYPNIVVTQTTAIFQLLPVKDKTLLILRDSFFALNCCFHYLNDVCRFHFQTGRLFSRCFFHTYICILLRSLKIKRSVVYFLIL